MNHNKEEQGPVGNIEKLTDSAKEYIDMRIDSFKLRIVENLSLFVSKILYMLLLIIILGVAIAFIASALSLFIGNLLNSEAQGAIITAGIFILMAAVIFLIRKRLFINSMVKMFIPLFFEDNYPNNNKEEEA